MVSFDEMYGMLEDFELIEGPAREFMEVIEEADEDQRDITVIDAVRLTIQRQANVRTQVWMSDKGMLTLTQKDADLDSDGTVSPIEALQLLVRQEAMFEEGRKIVAEWAAESQEAGARRHGRGVVSRGSRDFVSGLAKWKNFMCRSQNALHTILERVAPRFSVAMVKNRIERVKGLIEAIKTLVDLVSKTVGHCTKAVSGIVKGIAGIFTGNIIGGIASIVGSVGDTISCISGIMEIVQQVRTIHNAVYNFASRGPCSFAAAIGVPAPLWPSECAV